MQTKGGELIVAIVGQVFDRGPAVHLGLRERLEARVPTSITLPFHFHHPMTQDSDTSFSLNHLLTPQSHFTFVRITGPLKSWWSAPGNAAAETLEQKTNSAESTKTFRSALILNFESA